MYHLTYLGFIVFYWILLTFHDEFSTSIGVTDQIDSTARVLALIFDEDLKYFSRLDSDLKLGN